MTMPRDPVSGLPRGEEPGIRQPQPGSTLATGDRGSTLETAKEFVLRHYPATWADKRMGGWYLNGCPEWIRSVSGPAKSARRSWAAAQAELQSRGVK